MAKDFLYCEETDTKIYPNDVVSIATYPNTKWVVKQGWYYIDSARKYGWYFISLTDKSIISIDVVDIVDITKDTNRGTNKVRQSIPEPTTEETKIPEYLYCESTETTIYPNDSVIIDSNNYIAKCGWYNYDGSKKKGWYFLSVEDKIIIPLADISLENVIKDIPQGTSELRPTIQDMDSTPPEINYIVIPGTNIRLYDSDIVKISNKTGKWVVHSGWYIYDDVQNFGWYFVSIKSGEVLPVTVIDLTLVTLVTDKTQGSERYDGKVVNYTRPFTLADAEILNRTFITLDTIEQRDNLDKTKIIDGKMVRVNNEEGPASYYAWNEKTQTWNFLEVFGIPEVVGTTQNPIILSELEPALYRVRGTYKISPNHPTTYITTISHLAFVDDNDNIKVITEHDITDYIVEDGDITFISTYATVKYVEENYAKKVYVDNKIAVLEAEISEIISEFPDKVREIVYEVLGEALNGIEEEYIDNLFN